ncbi:UNVERIFIED_CONTAM: hypothetical protein FKN15_026095 [Acipenser sinensis]
MAIQSPQLKFWPHQVQTAANRKQEWAGSKDVVFERIVNNGGAVEKLDDAEDNQGSQHPVIKEETSETECTPRPDPPHPGILRVSRFDLERGSTRFKFLRQNPSLRAVVRDTEQRPVHIKVEVYEPGGDVKEEEEERQCDSVNQEEEACVLEPGQIKVEDPEPDSVPETRRSVRIGEEAPEQPAVSSMDSGQVALSSMESGQPAALLGIGHEQSVHNIAIKGQTLVCNFDDGLTSTHSVGVGCTTLLSSDNGLTAMQNTGSGQTAVLGIDGGQSVYNIDKGKTLVHNFDNGHTSVRCVVTAAPGQRSSHSNQAVSPLEMPCNRGEETVPTDKLDVVRGDADVAGSESVLNQYRAPGLHAVSLQKDGPNCVSQLTSARGKKDAPQEESVHIEMKVPQAAFVQKEVHTNDEHQLDSTHTDKDVPLVESVYTDQEKVPDPKYMSPNKLNDVRSDNSLPPVESVHHTVSAPEPVPDRSDDMDTDPAEKEEEGGEKEGSQISDDPPEPRSARSDVKTPDPHGADETEMESDLENDDPGPDSVVIDKKYVNVTLDAEDHSGSQHPVIKEETSETECTPRPDPPHPGILRVSRFDLERGSTRFKFLRQAPSLRAVVRDTEQRPVHIKVEVYEPGGDVKEEEEERQCDSVNQEEEACVLEPGQIKVEDPEPDSVPETRRSVRIGEEAPEQPAVSSMDSGQVALSSMESGQPAALLGIGHEQSVHNIAIKGQTLVCNFDDGLTSTHSVGVGCTTLLSSDNGLTAMQNTGSGQTAVLGIDGGQSVYNIDKGKTLVHNFDNGHTSVRCVVTPTPGQCSSHSNQAVSPLEMSCNRGEETVPTDKLDVVRGDAVVTGSESALNQYRAPGLHAVSLQKDGPNCVSQLTSARGKKDAPQEESVHIEMKVPQAAFVQKEVHTNDEHQLDSTHTDKDVPLVESVYTDQEKVPDPKYMSPNKLNDVRSDNSLPPVESVHHTVSAPEPVPDRSDDMDTDPAEKEEEGGEKEGSQISNDPPEPQTARSDVKTLDPHGADETEMESDLENDDRGPDSVVIDKKVHETGSLHPNEKTSEDIEVPDPKTFGTNAPENQDGKIPEKREKAAGREGDPQPQSLLRNCEIPEVKSAHSDENASKESQEGIESTTGLDWNYIVTAV